MTDELHGERKGDDVRFVAWAPDANNRQVAFIANWDGAFHAYIAPVEGDAKLGEKKSLKEFQGCEVSWRSDGRELALAQRSCAGNEPGLIVRANTANLRFKPLPTLGGLNPAWEPLSLGP